MRARVHATHLIQHTWTRRSTALVAVHSTSSSHFHCTRSSLRFIVVPCRTLHSTRLFRSMNPKSFGTDWILSSGCSFVTLLFVHVHTTVWHRIIGTKSSCAGVSLQHCLGKSLHTLRKCLYCVAFLHIAGMTDLCSCHRLSLPWTDHSPHHPAGLARGLLLSCAAGTLREILSS